MMFVSIFSMYFMIGETFYTVEDVVFLHIKSFATALQQRMETRA